MLYEVITCPAQQSAIRSRGYAKRRSLLGKRAQGLVAKAGVWYLVCARNEAIQVHRVSNLLDVQVADDSFRHPADFDLAEFWDGWCREYESLQVRFTATVRVAPNFVAELPRRFGHQMHEQIAQAGPPDKEVV